MNKQEQKILEQAFQHLKSAAMYLTRLLDSEDPLPEEPDAYQVEISKKAKDGKSN